MGRTSHRNQKKESKYCNDHGYDECDKFKKQMIKKQSVCHQKVKESNFDTINTDEIFINDKLFPTSIIPFKINGTTTIVGNNVALPACVECNETCPTATPGTPSDGLFTLGKSFSGKITFCGVKGLTLDLVALNVSNDNDYAIELINCDKVYIKGGNVSSKNATAILVKCCSNVEIAWINMTDTKNGIKVENSYNVKIKEWNMTKISGLAVDVDCVNYLRIEGLDVNNISKFGEDSLVSIKKSEMVFVKKCVFYNINVENHENLVDFTSVVCLDECFDVKISAISILTTNVFALPGKDVNLYLFYIKNSGSMVLSNFIIDGDHLTVSGVSKGVFNCIRLVNCNNTFVAKQLFTDNSVVGDNTSTQLDMTTFYIQDVDTFGLNSMKSLTNYVFGGNVNTNVKVKSFYGIRGGNWYLSGNISAQNYNEQKDDLFLLNASVCSFEIVDISSTVYISSSSGNNNGEINFQGTPKHNAGEVAGFKLYGVDPANNSFTNVVIDNCQANRNISNTTFGKTIGIMSTYSNTKVHSSYAISNESGLECYGILLPGLPNVKQRQAAVYTTSANNNFSHKTKAYGVYAGSINLNGVNTLGVETFVALKSSFNGNGLILPASFNPSYGIYLSNVKNSKIISNTFNQNQYGVYINKGGEHLLVGNSATDNDVAYELKEAPNSLIKNNSSQNNDKGFVDNSQYNVYYKNESIGDTLSFQEVSPSRFSWFAFDPTTGSFTATGPGVATPLNSFSNISTV